MSDDTVEPPDHLNVGIHRYQLQVDHSRQLDRDGFRGSTFTNELRIVVDAALPTSRLRETVVHEALHAISDAVGLDDVLGTAPSADDCDEMIASLLAPAIVALLRDNPGLVGWLVDGTGPSQ